MDTIHVENLVFSGKHGVGEEERNLEQEFEVSAELAIDTTRSAQSDDISDTVDYSVVKNIIRDAVEGSSCYLMEKLAQDIATRILVDAKVARVSVTVRKTHIWENGVPSVTVTRGRN